MKFECQTALTHRTFDWLSQWKLRLSTVRDILQASYSSTEEALMWSRLTGSLISVSGTPLEHQTWRSQKLLHLLRVWRKEKNPTGTFHKWVTNNFLFDDSWNLWTIFSLSINSLFSVIVIDNIPDFQQLSIKLNCYAFRNIFRHFVATKLSNNVKIVTINFYYSLKSWSEKYFLITLISK